MTAGDIQRLVRTFRFTDAIYVVVDSLPEPYQSDFWGFLRGSAIPVGDGRHRYAYPHDFERWLACSALLER